VSHGAGSVTHFLSIGRLLDEGGKQTRLLLAVQFKPPINKSYDSIS